MCVGGNPADYKSLAGKWARKPNDLEQVVALFVQDLIGKAMSAASVSVAADARKRGLYLLFRDSGEVLESVLEEMNLVRSTPDKVLRAVSRRTSACSRGGGRRILIPADAATALVLRAGITDTPSISKLRALAALVG